MLFMRWALYAGVAVAMLAGWTSYEAGFPPEVAATRGVLAFLAFAVAGYVAELVVVTARRPRRSAAGAAYPRPHGIDTPAQPGGVSMDMDDLAAALDERARTTEQRAA